MQDVQNMKVLTKKYCSKCDDWFQAEEDLKSLDETSYCTWCAKQNGKNKPR